jgi:hypothetical protein
MLPRCGAYPYATQSVDGSAVRISFGVSSIMSTARRPAGQPGFKPRRRATMLCTPSAPTTTGASNERPGPYDHDGRRQHARIGKQLATAEGTEHAEKLLVISLCSKSSA